MNPIKQLSELTEREREVLRLFCDGLDYKAIGEKLFIAVPTVKTHMGNIYIKLGLCDLPPAKRKIVLAEKYCPLLRKAELPPGPPDETDEPEPVPEPVMKVVEEDERAIVPWRPPRPPVIIIEPLREIEPLPRPRPRRLPWLLVGMVLGALLLVGIIYVVGRFLGTEEPPVVKYIEVTRGVIVEVTSTPAPPQPAPVPTVQTQEATATREQDTPTIAPPSPTPTPTPTPRPLPFEDNFDMGPRPEWEPVSGNWRMVNGQYTATGFKSAWAYSLVGDLNWQDYVVEADYSLRDSYTHVAILVRAGGASGLGLSFEVSRAFDNRWRVWQEGEWSTLATGEKSNASGHIRVEVRGSTFTGSVDGLRQLVITDNSTTAGRVGVGITCRGEADCPAFDNFQVTQVGE